MIWAASALHEIFMGHGRSIAERTARISDPQFLGEVVGRCSGISYNYRGQVPGAQAAQAGGLQRETVRRMWTSVMAARCSRTPAARAFRCWGFREAKGSSPRLATALDGLQRRNPSILRSYALPAGAELARRHGTAPEDRLCLVRPDGYVGHLCRVDQAQSIAEHLGRWFLAA